MTGELELFREQARRFVEKEVLPHDPRWQKQHHVDREIWDKAGRAGLLLPDVPEAYGGGGGNFAHTAVFTEELGLAGIWSFNNAVHLICAHYILNHGTEEQKRRFLPRLASGELVGAIAMTEPGAGSDLQAIRTRALRDGEDYVLNGSKIFITNGYLADLVVVVAKTDPSQRAKGISLLLVETRESPGFRAGHPLDKIGQHGQDTCELFFENVRVPAANLIGGGEGRGFFQLMADLPYERMLVAISSLAMIERALDLTVRYTRERMAFGKPLLEQQNSRFKLAEVRTTAAVGRSFLDQCVQRMMEGTLDAAAASMAKWWLSERACEAIDECLQLFGGYGYMAEFPIARMYTDARVLRIFAGANEIMKELIARTL
ncbi:MAG: acyl-CoA dehydrogenase family protein [Burkholderiales bacterium]|nr:acyl-CoA dehydrogenase family protein [Burkholderiales bacterium]